MPPIHRSRQSPATAWATRCAVAWAAAVMLSTSALAQASAAAPLSPDARNALEQILARRDNAGAPFVVIDKRRAALWVFDGQGRPRGSTPVLLGLAVGDHTVPGIGDRPLKEVRPDERTTPAGRFVAEHGRNLSGEDVIWVDYDAAVSMHRVRATVAAERRLQRLASKTSADNRISYGCINVPAAFYDQTLLKTIGRERPVVYVLPETRRPGSLFVAG
jgi:hypothetical protein